MVAWGVYREVWLHHRDIAGWLGAGGVLAAGDPWEPTKAPIRNGNGSAHPRSERE